MDLGLGEREEYEEVAMDDCSSSSGKSSHESAERRDSETVGSRDSYSSRLPSSKMSFIEPGDDQHHDQSMDEWESYSGSPEMITETPYIPLFLPSSAPPQTCVQSGAENDSSHAMDLSDASTSDPDVDIEYMDDGSESGSETETETDLGDDHSQEDTESEEEADDLTGQEGIMNLDGRSGTSSDIHHALVPEVSHSSEEEPHCSSPRTPISPIPTLDQLFPQEPPEDLPHGAYTHDLVPEWSGPNVFEDGFMKSEDNIDECQTGLEGGEVPGASGDHANDGHEQLQKEVEGMESYTFGLSTLVNNVVSTPFAESEQEHMHQAITGSFGMSTLLSSVNDDVLDSPWAQKPSDSSLVGTIMAETSLPFGVNTDLPVPVATHDEALWDGCKELMGASAFIEQEELPIASGWTLQGDDDLMRWSLVLPPSVDASMAEYFESMGFGSELPSTSSKESGSATGSDSSSQVVASKIAESGPGHQPVVGTENITTGPTNAVVLKWKHVEEQYANGASLPVVQAPEPRRKDASPSLELLSLMNLNRSNSSLNVPGARDGGKFELGTDPAVMDLLKHPRRQYSRARASGDDSQAHYRCLWGTTGPNPSPPCGFLIGKHWSNLKFMQHLRDFHGYDPLRSRRICRWAVITTRLVAVKRGESLKGLKNQGVLRLDQCGKEQLVGMDLEAGNRLWKQHILSTTKCGHILIEHSSHGSLNAELQPTPTEPDLGEGTSSAPTSGKQGLVPGVYYRCFWGRREERCGQFLHVDMPDFLAHLERFHGFRVSGLPQKCMWLCESGSEDGETCLFKGETFSGEEEWKAMWKGHILEKKVHKWIAIGHDRLEDVIL